MHHGWLILVANMNDSAASPFPLGVGNAPGSPTIKWNGGGNSHIKYDSCAINALGQSVPFQDRDATRADLLEADRLKRHGFRLKFLQTP